ncbi:MAG: hypothetical protein A3D19_09270 [Deltaproteobacteria bacterium RIFCSPHIGHO2_02_FULL_38_15]|nr:MAG: hypothetical protein A3D19_09270 [Deltaproteobacteria bacterium RIFCSPHIGHO2_02_FULL_38_15]
MPDLTVLKDSIQRKGILQPIIVKCHSDPRLDRGEESLQIVSGFRRLDCARALGLTQVPALIVEGELSDLALFERALEENLFSRPFNLIEKTIVLQKLKVQFHVPESLLIEKYMPIIGLDPAATVYQRYQELLNLENSIQIYIVQQNLPLHVIESFLAYTQKEQKMLSSFLSPIHFTVSGLKEFLIWVREVMVRDKVELSEILSSVHSCSQYEEVKKVLKLKRYPRLSELEEKFKVFKQSLSLPLEAPLFFEDNKIQMKFGFRNKIELKEWAQKIDRALDKKELEEMLKLL